MSPLRAPVDFVHRHRCEGEPSFDAVRFTFFELMVSIDDPGVAGCEVLDDIDTIPPLPTTK